MRTRLLPLTAFLLSALAYVPSATAQDEPAPSETETAAEDAAEPTDEAEPEGEKAADSEAAAAAGATDLSSPVEEKGKSYKFVGLRYRAIIVPEFMFGVFGADGGTTVVAHSIGPEFAIRKDNFEYQFSITYTGYGMDPTPIKATSDPEPAWEIVESNLKVLYLTADFLWSHDFSPQVALNYGVGAGFGLVFGDLIREQAYRDSASGEYLPCTAVGIPDPTYCADDNDHYNNYSEPSWANGGSKPILFPWLAVQTGVRYKPHRNFVGRLDVGFGLGQFFIGLGADYGL